MTLAVSCFLRNNFLCVLQKILKILTKLICKLFITGTSQAITVYIPHCHGLLMVLFLLLMQVFKKKQQKHKT